MVHLWRELCSDILGVIAEMLCESPFPNDHVAIPLRKRRLREQFPGIGRGKRSVVDQLLERGEPEQIRFYLRNYKHKNYWSPLSCSPAVLPLLKEVSNYLRLC